MIRVSLIDSHCHLDFPQFKGKIDKIIARAQAANVTRMVTICTKLSDLSQVKAIAKQHKTVFYAVGIHPMSVAENPMIQLDQLIKASDHPKMVGIGETGLDYHYSAQSADMQKRSLNIHIQAAQKTQLPLIIHARNADTDMAQILTDGYKIAPYRCVMHCFSSGESLARQALNLGFYLSMSGIITFKNAPKLRDIFAKVPLNRILLETDSPYLAPVPYRGKRNEPAYVAHIARYAAQFYGLSYAKFAAQTTGNFNHLFNKCAAYDSGL